MEITLVKAAGPGDRDRAWLTVGDVARRGPVHVIHDLPHLVVESPLGITDCSATFSVSVVASLLVSACAT